MAFEGLSEKLSATFKKLKNRGKLGEADVKDMHSTTATGWPVNHWTNGQPVAVVECIVLSHDGTAMDAGTFKVPAQTGCAILRRNAVIA